MSPSQFMKHFLYYLLWNVVWGGGSMGTISPTLERLREVEQVNWGYPAGVTEGAGTQRGPTLVLSPQLLALICYHSISTVWLSIHLCLRTLICLISGHWTSSPTGRTLHPSVWPQERGCASLSLGPPQLWDVTWTLRPSRRRVLRSAQGGALWTPRHCREDESRPRCQNRQACEGLLLETRPSHSEPDRHCT